MIFKNELQNAIKEYFKTLVEKKVDAWKVIDINADIQKIIEKLDANPWNPVDESVPSDDRYVLLSFDNFTIPQIGRYETDEDCGGAFFLGDDDMSLANYGLFVNAWMELPERYNGV